MTKFLTLKKRKDFVRIQNKGRSVVGPSFILVAMQNPDESDAGIRVGYTASKKLGNAVVRNRCKRRMRILSQVIYESSSLRGYDCVIIARHRCKTTSFSKMEKELSSHILSLTKKDNS